MNITLFLADDHSVVRAGLRLLLETEPDFEVVGEASNGSEAVRKIMQAEPDIAIIDIAMPNLNGIEVIRQLREANLATRVIILSMHSNQNHIFRALQAGAQGYVLKSSVATELIAAVKTVWVGRRYLSQKISNQTIQEYLNFKPPDTKLSPLERLSPREKEILRLVVDGKTSAQIAKDLSISPNTVDTYRSRIMHKLGFHDIPNLVKFAIQQGITSLD